MNDRTKQTNSHTPAWAIFFTTRMMKRDQFAVAKFLVSSVMVFKRGSVVYISWTNGVASACRGFWSPCFPVSTSDR